MHRPLQENLAAQPSSCGEQTASGVCGTSNGPRGLLADHRKRTGPQVFTFPAHASRQPQRWAIHRTFATDSLSTSPIARTFRDKQADAMSVGLMRLSLRQIVKGWRPLGLLHRAFGRCQAWITPYRGRGPAPAATQAAQPQITGLTGFSRKNQTPAARCEMNIAPVTPCRASEGGFSHLDHSVAVSASRRLRQTLSGSTERRRSTWPCFRP